MPESPYITRELTRPVGSWFRGAGGGSLEGGLTGGLAGFSVGGPIGAGIGAGIGVALGGLVSSSKRLTENFDELIAKTRRLVDLYAEHSGVILQLQTQWRHLDRRVNQAWARTLEPVLKEVSKIGMEFKERWTRIKIEVYRDWEWVTKGLIKILNGLMKVSLTLIETWQKTKNVLMDVTKFLVTPFLDSLRSLYQLFKDFFEWLFPWMKKEGPKPFPREELVPYMGRGEVPFGYRGGELGYRARKFEYGEGKGYPTRRSWTTERAPWEQQMEFGWWTTQKQFLKKVAERLISVLGTACSAVEGIVKFLTAPFSEVLHELYGKLKELVAWFASGSWWEDLKDWIRGSKTSGEDKRPVPEEEGGSQPQRTKPKISGVLGTILTQSELPRVPRFELPKMTATTTAGAFTSLGPPTPAVELPRVPQFTLPTTSTRQTRPRFEMPTAGRLTRIPRFEMPEMPDLGAQHDTYRGALAPLAGGGRGALRGTEAPTDDRAPRETETRHPVLRGEQPPVRVGEETVPVEELQRRPYDEEEVETQPRGRGERPAGGTINLNVLDSNQLLEILEDNWKDIHWILRCQQAELDFVRYKMKQVATYG